MADMDDDQTLSEGGLGAFSPRLGPSVSGRFISPQSYRNAQAMDATLRMVPSAQAQANVKSVGSHSDFGVHDTLRYGIRSVRAEVLPPHPLENSERMWNDTRETMRNTLVTSAFGVHANLRPRVEKSILCQARRFPGLPSTTLGLDIIQGRDEGIEVEDIFRDEELFTDVIDIHGVAEQAVFGRVL